MRTLKHLMAGIVFLAAMSAGGTALAAQHLTAHTHALHKTVKTINGGKAGYSFSPVKITVKVGTKITWKNVSSAPHTVTSDKSGLFNKTLATGGTVSLTFKKAGTYKYRCTYHPGMDGTVVVKK